MRIRALFFFVNILIINALSAQKSPLQDSVQFLSVGHTRWVDSEILGEIRTLNVYLPYGYDPQKSYPVVYVLDGTIYEDFIHLSGLTQFFSMMYGAPECIVAGISNVDRKRDFSFPTQIKALKEKYPTTGGSAAFIEFIEKELQPFIQSNYRTTGDRYLIGQSLGGLLAAEILMKKPHLFTHYFIVSPSMWWDNSSLLQQADQWFEKSNPRPAFVYVSVGANEGRMMERGAKKLYKKFKKSTYKSPKTRFKKIKKENHATVLHESIYQGLKLLYSK